MNCNVREAFTRDLLLPPRARACSQASRTLVLTSGFFHASTIASCPNLAVRMRSYWKKWFEHILPPSSDATGRTTIGSLRISGSLWSRMRRNSVFKSRVLRTSQGNGGGGLPDSSLYNLSILARHWSVCELRDLALLPRQPRQPGVFPYRWTFHIVTT